MKEGGPSVIVFENQLVLVIGFREMNFVNFDFGKFWIKISPFQFSVLISRMFPGE